MEATEVLLESCHKNCHYFVACSKIHRQRRRKRRGCFYHRSGLQPATLLTLLLIVHLLVGCDTVMLLRAASRRRRRRLASSEPLNGWSWRPMCGSEEFPLGSHEVPPTDPWEPERVSLCSPFPSSFNWCHRSSSPLADWPGGR